MHAIIQVETEVNETGSEKPESFRAAHGILVRRKYPQWFSFTEVKTFVAY